MTLRHDVAYDPSSAQEAMEQLEQISRDLDALTSAREGLARRASHGWHGAGRAGFDHRLAAVVTRSEELAHELRRAAEDVAAAIEEAAHEQRRREHHRAANDPPVTLLPEAG